MSTDLQTELSKRTQIFNLKLWVLIGILIGLLTILLLLLISVCLALTKKSKPRLPISQIPAESKEIKEIRIDQASANNNHDSRFSHGDSDAQVKKKNMMMMMMNNADNNSSHSGCSSNTLEDGSYSGEKAIELYYKPSSPITAPSPLNGLPEFSRTGWGHWFTLRDLEIATNRFSKENVIGEGGYGIVYRGHLINGTPVAVKKLLNNLGQAEKEFKVEVEAIGHVRHKNLVRLLGYCIEGTQRMLVYQYVNNGNLEQWLHGSTVEKQYLTWEARMKIILGTAKALAYLHEAIEPKVVHRDIKSSNILLDRDFNAKISDFGLAKLLGAGKSHVATRVMGTFGYVAPEYANSGLLNEKSDVYSFGVVILEAITGRDPVDYSRPEYEVNMVEWLKTMIGSRRTEEVIDPKIEDKPTSSGLKRALLTALRCVDPDAEKRPNMGQVVRMLESEEYPLPRKDRRRGRTKEKTVEATEESTERENSDTDKSDGPVLKSEDRSHHHHHRTVI
ncbi:probable receptor-like protein kinase At3g17420 [Impatiens glandulifera]|uniref:probable receptor-like protein kinase At3g17420 n=1 Tax=Impatiens glandulifera TaxID=253017 RepID=UPI001FB0BFEB|nr:probable receptor-like protein kinase At3g17420 [Impatiens glandulifera]